MHKDHKTYQESMEEFKRLLIKEQIDNNNFNCEVKLGFDDDYKLKVTIEFDVCKFEYYQRLQEFLNNK